jgi:hypothetical protein
MAPVKIVSPSPLLSGPRPGADSETSYGRPSAKGSSQPLSKTSPDRPNRLSRCARRSDDTDARAGPGGWIGPHAAAPRSLRNSRHPRPVNADDLGPSRSRARSRGPRPDAPPPSGGAASSRRGGCPAVGTRPPAPGWRRPRRRRSGRSGRPGTGRGTRRRGHGRSSRSGGTFARRGPPHRAFDRSVTSRCYAAQRPRGEWAMDALCCPPRKRATRRYAA